MITDPDEAKEQLLKWSSDYSSVQITESALTFDGISIDATAKLHNGYSVASVFLQIRDPEIPLVLYRSVCRELKVIDPIKPSDKAQIVAEFAVTIPTTAVEFREHQQQQKAQPPPPDSHSKTPAPPVPPSNKEKSRSSSSKSGNKRPPPPPSTSSRKAQRTKKPVELVTTEQLFENLNGVVDKRRSVGLSKIEAVITKALSTNGFDVPTTINELAKKRTDAIMAKEIPVGNSASILRSNDPRKDLKRVLELYKEAVMIKPKDKSSSAASNNNTATTNASGSGTTPSKNVRAHLIGQKPVIVVPKGMTAPITLLNAHAFFANATFIPRDQIKSTVSTTGRQKQLQNTVPTKFTHNVLGKYPLEFDITDNPSRLFEGGTKDWDRIVAVIVLGQDWQFTDWIPGFNAPATLFERVFGYYIGDKPPAQWAVKSGMLHRDRRGLDGIVYTAFWTQLEEWMRVHKPELIPKSSAAE